jgi:Cd2+/Zn2+-exporting ATPase
LTIVGIVLFAAGVFLTYSSFGLRLAPPITPVLFAAAYLLVARDVLMSAGKNIASGRIFDENFLMAVASIGAFVIGEYPEAVAVILFYNVGEYLQGRAVRHSKKSISALMDIRPDSANVIREDGSFDEVAAENVQVNALILIKPGERVPLDGVVEDGVSAMDTKALTGESLPCDVKKGDRVLSGFVNGQGLLRVRVAKAFSESTASRIIEMVESAGGRKAKTENFITTFARYYTPAVVGVAVLLAIVPPLAGAGSFADWIYRALVFLVVSCPCALVISIPLSFFGGIGAASSRGVLVKGGNFLEALNRVDTVVFDKTGTLTEGEFNVVEILPADGRSREDVLRLGALAERHSTHPIAVSICETYDAAANGTENPADGLEIEEIAGRGARVSANGTENPAGGLEIEEIAGRGARVSANGTENPAGGLEIEEIAGRGVRASSNGKVILAGSGALLKADGVQAPELECAGTVVYIAENGEYCGAIIIADRVKRDSAAAINELRKRRVDKIIMLTGDNRRIAGSVAESLGIDRVEAELLPNEKLDIIEEIISAKETLDRPKNRKKVLFAGDGINDAPVLARADIGVAMGGVGSDAAIEAADVVIMNDEPSKLAVAIDIARNTHRIVWQNIFFALGVKGLVLLLAAAGFATMWEAVFADVGVALIATLNAVRAGHGVRR